MIYYTKYYLLSFLCVIEHVISYHFIPYIDFSVLGGLVGVIIPSFISAATPGPLKPWHLPMAYPAIGGRSSFNRTTFANFVKACGKTPTIFKTNPSNGDISHPMDLEKITFVNVTEGLKVLINTPNKKWINPSDCVDMDCDALRKIVMKDIDGSFLGNAGGSLVSRSEYQWDGDRAFGLGKRCFLSRAEHGIAKQGIA